MSSQANTSENQDKVIIGARALGDQIYKIMPTYDLLLEQLNEISLSAVKQLDSQIFFSSEKIGGKLQQATRANVSGQEHCSIQCR